MSVEVSDTRSNAAEQIDHAARVLGRSKHRIKVFKAIYHGKQAVKSVSELMDATDLPRLRVLQEAGTLANNKVVQQVKKNGETAYQKNNFYHANKKKILALAASPKKLQSFPTKRNPSSAGAKPVTIHLRSPSGYIAPLRISIDDVTSFAKVSKVAAAGNLPASVSETRFKKGIQRLLGQKGVFKDWGGERNDLFSTRLVYRGRRRAAAFGFKGPGQKGKLTPKRMGMNGDQIQRLLESPAEVFFVQHWREIDESVLYQLESLAITEAVRSPGKRIYYGIIDGQDSMRLMSAYPKAFAK